MRWCNFRYSEKADHRPIQIDKNEMCFVHAQEGEIEIIRETGDRPSVIGHIERNRIKTTTMSAYPAIILYRPSTMTYWFLHGSFLDFATEDLLPNHRSIYERLFQNDAAPLQPSDKIVITYVGCDKSHFSRVLFDIKTYAEKLKINLEVEEQFIVLDAAKKVSYIELDVINHEVHIHSAAPGIKEKEVCRIELPQKPKRHLPNYLSNCLIN